MLASQRSLYCYFLGDDNNDPSDPSDLKSNQKSAKSGDLCVEIKLGKIKSSIFNSLAEVFYSANYWSPIITSKNSSENLSNHNKHLCFCTVFSSFCCLQDKTWIKMPKWTIFLISSKEFVLITEIFWRIFWRDNWRSLIGGVENFR